jgi:hypothetical protein
MKKKTSKTRQKARQALAKVKKRFELLHSRKDNVDASQITHRIKGKQERIEYCQALIREFS